MRRSRRPRRRSRPGRRCASTSAEASSTQSPTAWRPARRVRPAADAGARQASRRQRARYGRGVGCAPSRRRGRNQHPPRVRPRAHRRTAHTAWRGRRHHAVELPGVADGDEGRTGLITGNTIVAKPAPTTPLTALLFGEMAADILPPGVLNIIVDDNDLGAAMTKHKDIAKVSFTGSTVTGKKVMECVATTLNASLSNWAAMTRRSCWRCGRQSSHRKSSTRRCPTPARSASRPSASTPTRAFTKRCATNSRGWRRSGGR